MHPLPSETNGITIVLFFHSHNGPVKRKISLDAPRRFDSKMGGYLVLDIHV